MTKAYEGTTKDDGAEPSASTTYESYERRTRKVTETVKLAEALIERADAQRRIAELQTRIQLSAVYQEGDEPTENALALLEEATSIQSELSGLVKSINRTNAQTAMPPPANNNTTIADAIAERELLQRQVKILRDAAHAAQRNALGRYSRSEIKFVSDINVAEVQGRADGIARQARDLDAQIQAANWSTELA